jgi:hypothetical protein
MICLIPVSRRPARLVETPVVINRAASYTPVWQLSRPARADIRSVFFPSMEWISLAKPVLTMPRFPRGPQFEG